MIETLLWQDIVTKSDAPYYSQVLLVPKPDNSFRMSFDYTALNDFTPNANWPTPNIAEMLRSIGQHKPKLFGTMDLTQGHHQAPLDNTRRAFTVFTTFSGVYKFTRLPFGPKRTLLDLIYMICEMYIDDCIGYEDTNDEFVSVFVRFSKHNLHLKAGKFSFEGSKSLNLWVNLCLRLD